MPILSDTAAAYVGTTAVDRILRGSTEVWSPTTSLPSAGLQGVWEARLQAGTDGGPLNPLVDTSGNGHDATQGTSGRRATFHSSGGPNGQPYLSFDGGDFYDTTCPAASSNTLTLLVVCNPTSFAEDRVMVGARSGGGGAYFRCNASTGQRVLNDQNAAVLGTSTTTAATAGAWQSLMVTWDDPSGSGGEGVVSHYKNGILDEDSPRTDTDNLTPGRTLALGANRTGAATEHWLGGIALVAAWDRVLTAAERDHALAYVTSVYGSLEPTGSVQAAPLWSSDYESGALLDAFEDASWNHRPDSPEVRTDGGAFKGSRHGRYRCSTSEGEGPGGNTRCESVPADGGSAFTFTEGMDRWFGGAIRLAGNFPLNAPWQVLTQWKNDGTGSPPVELVVGSSSSVFRLDGNASGWHQDIGPVSRDVWHRFVFHIVFSAASASSRIDLWWNGTQILDNFKPSGVGTLYTGMSSYWKLGYYRDGSIATDTYVEHDNWRMGLSFDSVDPDWS